ncbi:MAG: DUF262 domain-containing protein [Flavobacteriales bacterium]|nr:DUF262 domain-containing protein [Flavobacteriales bacterium]
MEQDKAIGCIQRGSRTVQQRRAFWSSRTFYEGGFLKLSPRLQRQSVWAERDRTKLIDSIIQNYPLPAIFLYARKDKGDVVYDVIDGKQRIESVLMFMGVLRGRFKAKVQLPGAEAVEAVDWNLLKRRNVHLIHAYQIPVIEVDGDLGEIIDIFIRINSTGKALTPQEKRSAKYYSSALLKTAAALARKYERYFIQNKILSPSQISRMKSIELICELMLTLVQGDVLNKKTALDRVMATSSLDARNLAKGKKLVVSALNRVARMFPQLHTTRLRQVTDFYTLVALIGKYENEGLILTNAKRNDQAWRLLKRFSTQVDEVRELQRKARGAKPDQDLYRDYLLTVSQMTDDVAQRRKREQILDGILRNLFARKDEQRTFSLEQRRLLWNSEAKVICPKCKKPITWNDLSIDHILSHAKGGRTDLRIAQPMHKRCNSAKGAR